MSVTTQTFLSAATIALCLAGMPRTAVGATSSGHGGCQARTPDEARARAESLLAAGKEGAPLSQAALTEAAACFAVDCASSSTALSDLYEKYTNFPVAVGVPQCLLLSCEQNVGGPACQLGARALAQARGIAGDVKRATELFQRGCDSGSVDACENYMDFLRRTEAISAEEHGHLKACIDTIRSSALPCRDLSDFLAPKIAASVPTASGDPDARLSMFLHWGCRGQQRRLCVPYATLLLQAQKKTAALQILTTACGLGQEDACLALVGTIGSAPSGPAILAGIAAAQAAAAAAGTPVVFNSSDVIDEDNALRRYLYGQFCKDAARKAQACVDEDARWAAVIPMAEDFQKKCQDGNTRACTAAGLIRLSVENQPRGSAAYFRRACAAGGGQGCYFLALQREERHDLEEAGNLFQKSCDEPFGPGCTHLAEYYEKGKRVNKNGPEAMKALRVLACAAGDPAGCRSLVAHGGSLELPK